jgi:capsular exopolysaccharide synthesis family protein
MPPPPGLSSGPDARSLLKALGRRWLLALSLGLVVATGVGAAAWYLLAPRYTAFAQVKVSAFAPWILNPDRDSPEGRAEFETYKRLQASEITSRFVLLAALKKPSVKRLKLIQDQAEPLQFLEDELKVKMKEGSEILTVSLIGPDPDECIEIVRAVVAAYMEEVVSKERQGRKARLAQLQKTYNETREKLHSKKKTLRENERGSNGEDLQALKDKRALLLTSLSDVKKQHYQAEFELKQAETRLAQFKVRAKLLKNGTVSEQELSQAEAADPKCARYHQEIATAEKTIDIYEGLKVDPRTTTLVLAKRAKEKAESKIESRRKALKKDLLKRKMLTAKQEYDSQLEQLQLTIPSLKEQEKTVRAKVAQLTAQVNKQGSVFQEQDLLRNEIQQDEQLVNQLASKVNLLEIEVGSPTRVSLYQDAGLQKADTKRRMMAAILGPIASLVLVCFGVGWWEFRARRIQTPDEVVNGLGIRVVGAVPAVPGQALDRLVTSGDLQDGLESSMVESIDAIRTMLLRDASVESTRVVMVTSAVSGEGKTTLASNLATSLARAGRKTLLMDCDLRSPSAHQLFEQSLQPGFSEILLGEVDLIDAIRPTTAVDGLWLIPAGEWDREVVQALARSGVEETFDRLKEEFDFVVVDSHPVLPATDSLLLGQHVDAVILSLLKDVSQVPRVHAAGQRLTSLGIRVLGAVVNGIPAEACQNSYQLPALSAR